EASVHGCGPRRVRARRERSERVADSFRVSGVRAAVKPNSGCAGACRKSPLAEPPACCDHLREVTSAAPVAQLVEQLTLKQKRRDKPDEILGFLHFGLHPAPLRPPPRV